MAFGAGRRPDLAPALADGKFPVASEFFDWLGCGRLGSFSRRMATTPAVSVVMTTFNSGQFLAPAVESILGQTHGDFEFIIVDDASTDGTQERLSHWAARDVRIALVLQENNLGPPVTANRAVALAHAPWIARADHDDVSYPRRLEHLLAKADRQPEAVFVAGQWDLVDLAGKIRPGSRRLVFDWPLLEWLSLFSGFAGAQGQMLINAAAFRAVGGYDEQLLYGDDADLLLRLLARGPAALVRNPVFAYRDLVPGSMSARRGYRYHPNSLGVSVGEIRRRSGIEVTQVEAAELRDFWTRHPEGHFSPPRVEALVARIAATYRPVRPVASLATKIRDATARTWLSHALRAAKLQGPAAASSLLRRAQAAAGARWPFVVAGFAWRWFQVGARTWRLH